RSLALWQHQHADYELDRPGDCCEKTEEHERLLVGIFLAAPLTLLRPSTFKRPVSSWKALNLRRTLLMASSVRLKPLNCSRLPCVYAQETLTFLLTQKKTCVKNYVQKE